MTNESPTDQGTPISPELWESLVENSADVIMIVDVTGTIQYINHTVAGFDVEDTLVRNVREYVPADNSDELGARLRRVFETGEPESEQVFAAGPMNSGAYYLARIGPIKQNGQIVALSITATDITVLKTTEEALIDTASRLNAVLNNVAYGIISINGQGRIQSVNHAVERMFGYASEELLGKNIELLMPVKKADHQDRYFQDYSQTGRTNVIGDARELEGKRKDGSVFALELTVTAFTQNEEAMYTGILVDITRRKQTEMELRQSQKMEAMGLLAGGVAHDFNNMLSAIMSYTYLIKQKMPDNTDICKYGGEIQKAADRAAGLTRQLMAFSRQDVADPKVVGLGDIIEDLVKMIRHLIVENIRLVFRSPSDLWPVMVDVGYIEQVVINLALNARDAMPEGGLLSLDISNLVLEKRSDDLADEAEFAEYVVVTVSDNGTGMTPDVRPRIFEPFFTTKDVGKGSGLGLSTSHGIVKQMGGHIAVDSTPGMGSTFRVYIPRSNAPIESGHENAPHDSQLTGSGTVLLVEDEVILHDIAVLTLREFGYTVLTALNGSDALTVASEHPGPIDLLLTDVIMPYMGGLELSENLKAMHPEMRVLYTSGHIDDAGIRQIVSAKQGNFLRKPYSSPQLLEKVGRMLNHSSRSAYVVSQPTIE